jgi:DNA ligase-associated metallophosphoesterase
MNSHAFSFCGAELRALGSGALHWPDEALLVVSDLHFGKSERIARRSRQLLPPYETLDTLRRLEDAITATNPKTVICLGDSFDDLEVGRSMPEDQALWLTRLMAGRNWIWIEGNHDPGPLEFGGTHLAQYTHGPLVFRHIAQDAAVAEVSGHYHPKVSLVLRGRMVSRPSFLVSDGQLILPAFGTYTGGLRSNDAALQQIMGSKARAILTGNTPICVPMPL